MKRLASSTPIGCIGKPAPIAHLSGGGVRLLSGAYQPKMRARSICQLRALEACLRFGDRIANR